MAKKLDTLITRLERLANGGKMEAIVEKAADEQRELMVELQLNQLDDGERADGTRIDPPYAPQTVQIKKSQGRPTNKVTLFDTGNFYNSARAVKRGKEYIMEFSDSKTEKILDKYGEAVEGLQPDSVAQVGEAMVPSINKQTRNYLKL